MTNCDPTMVFAASDAMTPIDVAVVVDVVDVVVAAVDADVAVPARWSGGRCDDACDDCVTRWDLIWRMHHHHCCCRCCGDLELRSSYDWTIVVVVPAVTLM